LTNISRIEIASGKREPVKIHGFPITVQFVERPTKIAERIRITVELSILTKYSAELFLSTMTAALQENFSY